MIPLSTVRRRTGTRPGCAPGAIAWGTADRALSAAPKPPATPPPDADSDSHGESASAAANAGAVPLSACNNRVGARLS